jgi:hypothetical protein
MWAWGYSPTSWRHRRQALQPDVLEHLGDNPVSIDGLPALSDGVHAERQASAELES